MMEEFQIELKFKAHSKDGVLVKSRNFLAMRFQSRSPLLCVIWNFILQRLMFDAFFIASSWACDGWRRYWWCAGDSFGVPDFLMLMNKVIAREFGATNLAREKLHIYVFYGRHRRCWGHCCSRGCRIFGLKLSQGNSWLFCSEIHCKRIQMTTFMLLIAIMRLENVVAKDAFVDGATITFRLVGHYI